MRDITERKLPDEALLISEERLRQSVRVSNLGIFDHDHLAEKSTRPRAQGNIRLEP